MRDPAVKRALRDADVSRRTPWGVFGVPTVDVAGELFWGDDTARGLCGIRRLD